MKEHRIGRQMRRKFIGLTCTLSITLAAASCSTTPCPSGDCSDTDEKNTNVKGVAMEKPAGSDSELENVGQISFDGTKVLATVVSTGCTQSEHFTVVHEAQADTCLVQLIRTKPDYCRKAPFTVDIALPWQPSSECQSLPVAFANPVTELLADTRKPAATRQLK